MTECPQLRYLVCVDNEPGCFRPFLSIESGLQEAARVAVRDVLHLTAHESVLIVTNPQPEVHEISLALYDAAVEVGAAPVLAVQPTKGQLDFTEESVLGAIKSAPDVLISMSALKIGQDRETVASPIEHDGVSYDKYYHYLLHGVKTMRSFWSPGVTREMFARTVPINYRKLKSDCAKLSGILDEAIAVHVTSKLGTDLTIGLRDRRTLMDDGDFSKPGLGGNLPAGEVFISPELGTSSGTIVFDGSMTLHDGDVVVAEPIRATVDKGIIVSVEGGREAERLNETLSLGETNALLFEEQGRLPKGLGAIYRQNARNLGELGIGLNPAARVSGNMLEDEKVYRTCHLAIGRNYDEDAPALIHLDGLVNEPTITAFFSGGQRKTFVRNGEVL